MMAQMDQMAARTLKVDGVPTSLVDLGYVSVGLDDNWQDCGKGINGSFHDANGNPIINTDRFPDMKNMTAYAHSKGTRPGWYFNNCICRETGKLQPNWPPQMHGDVNAVYDLGYDGIKIDSCGPSHNLTEWNDLLNKTGRAILIENCHDNVTFPYWEDITYKNLVCPMHFYRVSNDIQSNWDSIFSNLQHTIPYLTESNPLSRPGCWAYPDMLEVGNGALTYEESRSHFGAWCVVSAPLILGFDLTKSSIMASVWDIISNKEAIAVSQSWQGHPGRLVAEDKISFPVLNKEFRGMEVKALPTWQVWAKKTGSDGTQAVLFVNLGSGTTDIEVRLTKLGLGDVKVRNIWEHKDEGQVSGSYTVKGLASHDSKFVLMTPIN
eukprot:CAMPEP_0174253276 /NCGR_PEP_ID=MMETSP0439-20130205/2647_1 /TAXON_ID=0 /ORGANISM="Stereomyxa ramosa, Strain Chinc5" /LENGTH=378 /DNA_ID=CAMNT_0015334217 /DNA_START=162 /DNA_END=1298 /DNA_ORIENTATION=+